MIFARFALFLLVAGGLAACSAGGSPRPAFDLSAATPGPQRVVKAQLRIRQPVTDVEIDSDRILVRTAANGLALLAGARWVDRLPDLLQARLTQTFQNTRGLRVAGEGASADYDVETDVRVFELDADQKQVDIELAVKLVATNGGRVRATRIFKAREAVSSTDPATVAAAFDHELAGLMAQIVEFAAASL
jgi:cholesterol transport system auxiliary component